MGSHLNIQHSEIRMSSVEMRPLLGSRGTGRRAVAGTQARTVEIGATGDMVGGMNYAAVSRFGKRLTKDTKLRNEIRRLETQLSNVEM